MNDEKCKPELKLKKDTPYLALTGEIWDVNYDDFRWIDRVITALYGAWVIDKIHRAMYGIRSIEWSVSGEVSNINYTK